MSSNTFPTANKTFSVSRNVIVNKQQTLQLISSNESVSLKDTQSYIDQKAGGDVFTGIYQGTTFTNTIIQIGDILTDNVEVDADNKPVKYVVTGKTIFIFYAKLHLTRSKLG